MDKISTNILKELCNEQWSNEACMGYIILACGILEYSEKEKRELMNAVENMFGYYTVSQAKEKYYTISI